MELKTIFLICNSDVIVKSDFLGEFPLDSGKTYRIKIDVKVASKNKDDLAYPKRNISAIIGTTLSERVKEIAEKI